MSNFDPNQNPYAAMPQQSGFMQPASHGSPDPHSARLGFFDCFFEAKDFLGTDYWLFWGLTFVGMFIAGVVPIVLMGPMYCGIGLCFLAREQGYQPSFDLLFKGFDKFMNTLVPILLYTLGALIVLPCYLAGLAGGLVLISTGEPIGIVLGPCLILAGVSILVIGGTLISYGCMFSCFLVADYNLEGMDAFNVSLSGIQKNLFGLFGVMIATLIASFCAALLCYIPLILMVPIFMCGPFICYRKIFRPRAKSAKPSVKIQIPK